MSLKRLIAPVDPSYAGAGGAGHTVCGAGSDTKNWPSITKPVLDPRKLCAVRSERKEQFWFRKWKDNIALHRRYMIPLSKASNFGK